jgi:quercetin dioxygenase-like cupin family protein
MRSRTFSLLAVVLFVACRHADTQPDAAPHGDSPFAMAAGIERAEGSDGSSFRIMPLRPMTGDVEILHGDPEKAGEPFAMRIRELPGTVIPMHSHPVDEHITVVQGTWYFAVGDTWDKSALKELRAGDYAFAPKGSRMFGYSPDGAIVQVHGVGPFHIHWVNGSKTLDDPDANATFTFRRGDRVQTPRGPATIRHGYASGDIVQYEVEGAGGVVHMVNQRDVRRD